MSDEDILERGGTQEDIDRYAHDVGGACGLAYGWTCDYCTTTDNTQELDEIPPRFALYLKARAMRDDDRSMPYIAKKLGFNNASSVDSLLKRYDWFYRWHNKQVEKSMAKFSLKKGVKYDVKASDSVIVITPVNKLKEANQ